MTRTEVTRSMKKGIGPEDVRKENAVEVEIVQQLANVNNSGVCRWQISVLFMRSTYVCCEILDVTSTGLIRIVFITWMWVRLRRRLFTGER